MKKMFFLLAMLLGVNYVSAQEVHGIETKLVCIMDCPSYESENLWSRTEDVYGKQRDEWEEHHFYSEAGVPRDNTTRYKVYPAMGYSFTNMNSIVVSVEAELYYKGNIIDSKSFILKSKESYVWKHGKMGIDIRDREEYFVKYKAYKML